MSNIMKTVLEKTAYLRLLTVLTNVEKNYIFFVSHHMPLFKNKFDFFKFGSGNE